MVSIERCYHEGYFTSRDGLKLFYRLWLSSNVAPPFFLILHGFGEHSARYVSFVEQIMDFPFTFATFDLRGHGESSGEMVYVERFEDYLSDIDSLLTHLNEHHAIRTEQIFLFGHSMGGEIGTYYSITKPERVASLILSSPSIEIECWLPFVGELIMLLAQFFPHQVINNPVAPIFLSHDKNEVARYKSDPLIRRKITLKLVSEMIRAGKLILKRASESTLPVYVLASGNDRIVKKKTAREFVDKISSKEKEWMEFDGFYHEIFNEEGKEKVYKALRNVLETALRRKPS